MDVDLKEEEKTEETAQNKAEPDSDSINKSPERFKSRFRTALQQQLEGNGTNTTTPPSSSNAKETAVEPEQNLPTTVSFKETIKSKLYQLLNDPDPIKKHSKVKIISNVVLKSPIHESSAMATDDDLDPPLLTRSDHEEDKLVSKPDSEEEDLDPPLLTRIGTTIRTYPGKRNAAAHPATPPKIEAVKNPKDEKIAVKGKKSLKETSKSKGIAKTVTNTTVQKTELKDMNSSAKQKTVQSAPVSPKKRSSPKSIVEASVERKSPPKSNTQSKPAIKHKREVATPPPSSSTKQSTSGGPNDSPKKRGWKRKSEPPEPQSEQQKVAKLEGEHVTSSRKSGRHRKPVNYVALAGLDKELRAEVSDEDSDPSVKVEPLPVRGKPEQNCTLASPGDSSTVKKKRGRPKKIGAPEADAKIVDEKNLEPPETKDGVKQTGVLPSVTSSAISEMDLSSKDDDDDENTSNPEESSETPDEISKAAEDKLTTERSHKPHEKKEVISAREVDLKPESSVAEETKPESEAQKTGHHDEKFGSSICDKDEKETSKELKTKAEDVEVTASEVIQVVNSETSKDFKTGKIDKDTENTNVTETKSENVVANVVAEKVPQEKTAPTCAAPRDLQTKVQDNKTEMSNNVSPKKSEDCESAASASSVSPATPKKRGRPPWKHLTSPKSNSADIKITSDKAEVLIAEVSNTDSVKKEEHLESCPDAKSPNVKRRGRPPKRKLLTSETITELDGLPSISTKDVENNDNTLPVVEKRGRPRTHSVLKTPDVANAEDFDDSTSTPPAKKKGRPKKHVSEETYTPETHSSALTRSGRRVKQTSYKCEQDESDEDQIETEIKPETASPAKKRGRPRKSANEAAANQDNGAATSSKDCDVDSPVVKKWGRPRKIRATENKNDEDLAVVKKESSVVKSDESSDLENKTQKPVKLFGKDSSGNIQVASYKGTVNTLISSIKSQTKEGVEDAGKEAEEVEDEAQEPAGRGVKRKRLERQTESANTVTCAVCHKSIIKQMWQYHKQRHHNNLAWRTDEPAMDLDNPKVVMNALVQLRKQNKPMYCAKCGEKKKSPVGYLSHLTTCQKSQQEIDELKIRCQLCQRMVLPVSMMAHLNLYHHENKGIEKIETDTAELGKRSAAVKAKNLISNWNSSSGDQEVDGKEFIKTEQGYECKHCEIIYKNKATMAIHISREHKNDDYQVSEGDEEDDTEEPEDAEFGSKQKRQGRKSSPQQTRQKSKIKFLADEMSSRFTFKPAYSWTLKFCEENFARSELFPEFASSSDWKKADLSVIADYLPKLKYSAYVEFLTDLKKYVDPIRLDCEWKRFKLFESKVHNNGDISIFCGGPISSMSWMPTPATEPDCDQILAVSATLDPDEVHYINRLYSEPGLLQFWNCGPLSATAKSEQCEPQLEFCILHDHGTVWHMEWCPSGCYRSRDDESAVGRYGLLAIACSDSFIYIYSICKQAESSGKMFQPKPVCKLILDRNEKAQVTKISWTKASGHKYIAAGYSNGMAAIFNLTTTNILLGSKDENGVCELLPFRVIQAHNHAVTGVSLYHLNEGRRWLLTTSLDKTVKYWDLENPIAPISNFLKSVTTDAAWMTHWICTLQTYDDYLGSNRTQLLQLRNYGLDRAVMIRSSSRVSTVTTSDWFNGISHGTLTGELNTIFTQQLITGEFKRANNKNLKFMISYARLVEKDASIEDRLAEERRKAEAANDEQPQKTELNMDSLLSQLGSGYEPLAYKEAAEKYAVVFCDFKKDTRNDAEAFEETPELFPNSQPNIYPLQSVTKVAFNPNKSSCIYLASGYQAGIVRVSRLSFLSSVVKQNS